MKDDLTVRMLKKYKSMCEDLQKERNELIEELIELKKLNGRNE